MITIPEPAKIDKREYNAGAKSAALTVGDYGLSWTIDYLTYKVRKCNRFTEPAILSYWAGYRAKLAELEG